MNNAERIQTPCARRWHNHLPAWISGSENHRELSARCQLVLQGIANACPPSSVGGSLIGAYGGRELIYEIGCSQSTFWVHIRRLESRGFVVVLSRGGLAISDQAGGMRHLGNVYAIPGEPGALDGRRVQRELCRMIRQGGRLRRQVVRPGAQATLWIDEPDHSENRSGATPKIGVGYSENRTLSSVVNHSSDKNPIGPRRVRTRKKRKVLRHITINDLTDIRRLVALYADSVSRGLVVEGDAAQLAFVAMAERALRMARRTTGPKINPLGLFAANVNENRWLLLSQQDEQRAHARLKRYEYGGHPHDR